MGLALGATEPRRGVWTVSGLVLAVGDALASRFATVAVSGEISGFSRASSGHCYFTLKDEAGAAALVRCAMFRRAASLVAFAPRDGQRVEIRGRLGVYEPRGELQLVVESMQAAGQGALMEQFLQLKTQLEAEGLFDARRKRALPPFVRRVGVITSLEAAALHDVLASLRRRAPHVGVVIYPSLVQGAQAPAALVAALAQGGLRAEVDVVILCRGGGSLEDLWAFNDPAVVRAVAQCPVPVVTGIGHDTDVSLCDFAADLHAPTPTAAAELAVCARSDHLALLEALAARLAGRVHLRLDQQAQRLDRLALRLTRPAEAIREQRRRVDQLFARMASAMHRAEPQRQVALAHRAQRLQRAAAVTLEREQRRLDTWAARLDASDPNRVLLRGYAWLTDASGRTVASVQHLHVGQSVRAVLGDGQAELLVQTLSQPGSE